MELEVRTPNGGRAAYIEAIVRLLEKADFRQLRLVWVYASHLIGWTPTEHQPKQQESRLPVRSW